MSDLCKLKKACEICVTDRGKEDDALAQRLYDYIYSNYVIHGSNWDYKLLNEVLDKFEKEVEFRNLDGVYFRVERNGKWKSVCFSDLTEEEMRHQIGDRSIEWLQELCMILGRTIRHIGDELDIGIGEEDE